jgi:hypothetical protein
VINRSGQSRLGRDLSKKQNERLLLLMSCLLWFGWMFGLTVDGCRDRAVSEADVGDGHPAGCRLQTWLVFPVLTDYLREPILSYTIQVSARFYQRMLIRVHELLKEEGKD